MASTLTGVVVISNDDNQQSEGINRACEQPVVSVFAPSVPSVLVAKVPKLFPVSDSNAPSRPSVPSGGVTGESSIKPPAFVPSWNLHNDSRLSVRANAFEFSRHAFPPAVVSDMEAMGNPALAHNMAYAAAQAMFYLVAGSRRVHSLGEMEAAHATCESRTARLEHRVGELGEDL